MRYFMIEKREHNQGELVILNNELQAYGFHISEEDYLKLLQAQKASYKRYNLIDLDTSIIMKIAEVVKNSPYIRQDTYIPLITYFLDLFYACRKQLGNTHYDDEIVNALFTSYLTMYGEISSTLLFNTLKTLGA